MKNLIYTLILILAAITPVSATDVESGVREKAAFCENLIDEGASEEKIAKSGCCSWHNGVCGCYGGRVSCCDGTLSPSCTCNKEEDPSALN